MVGTPDVQVTESIHAGQAKARANADKKKKLVCFSLEIGKISKIGQITIYSRLLLEKAVLQALQDRSYISYQIFEILLEPFYHRAHYRHLVKFHDTKQI